MRSCREHIEEALDVYLDEFEEMPVMEELEKKENSNTKCHFCQNLAVYQLGKSGVKASWE